MSAKRRIIRTVSDLAQLNDTELAACLKGLRQAVQKQRSQHAATIAAGDAPAGSPVPFDEFVWQPREPAEALDEAVLRGDTPVEALPLKPQARHALREMRILCLEDASAVTEIELRRAGGIGGTTVAKLRDLLAAIGLTFAPEPNPVRAAALQSTALRRLSRAQRLAALQGLADQEPVGRLGLRPNTLRKVLRYELQTVGKLRSMTPKEIQSRFGRNEGRELLAALSATGTGLRCEPSPLELWSAGVLDAAEMQRPAGSETPVAELAPWIGTMVRALARAGITTLGELRGRAEAGQLADISGLGPSRVAEVLAFLGLGQRRSAEKREPPRSSVFALDQDVE